MSKKKTKVLVTKEVKDMYYLLRDIGELTEVYDNMTGDYKKDIDSFAKQFSEVKKAINIDVIYDDEDL